ncbi:MAG TPA: hypothetical protein VFJ21_03695 [Mycobacteriales bacterium]|jgi:hypothetical protein|nr:hypothetical protein [Mycobacteriales bacterium]
MSEKIDVQAMGPHEFSVDVTEGTTKTSHRVTVPEDLLVDLGAPDTDEERLVHESFSFLLEKEKSTTILPEFPLDEIQNYFSDYMDAMRTRLAG